MNETTNATDRKDPVGARRHPSTDEVAELNAMGPIAQRSAYVASLFHKQMSEAGIPDDGIRHRKVFAFYLPADGDAPAIIGWRTTQCH